MKKIFFTFLIIAASYSSEAQIAIGKNSADGAALLDFKQDNGGIILPVVRTIPSGAGATDGTILINGVNLASVKAQMRMNGAWVDISDTAKDLSSLTLNTSTDSGNGVIIGANTSSASGVLVLESTEKALVLPKVSDVETDVKSPVVGTMVYDLASKSMAIYDGQKWNFWK